MADWLIDTSALSHLTHDKVAERVAGCIIEGASVCDQIVAESLIRATTLADLAARERFFDTVHVWPVDAGVWSRVGTIAEQLAEAGRMVSTGGAVIAACALVNDLTVLHYDSDYETLAEVIGLEHDWVVPRGSV